MNLPTASRCWLHVARVAANEAVSRGLIRLDLELPQPLAFAPGQFAMLNFRDERQLVFSRPFSILAADGNRASFLYRVVGRGTQMLAELSDGDELSVLGPLGTPFPAPVAAEPVILMAGGVGLPPLLAWWHRYGREGDRAYFGGRDGADIPWSLIDESWQVSVERAGAGDGSDDRPADLPARQDPYRGLVTDCCRDDDPFGGARRGLILGCGPLPMLAAVAALARERDWRCLVSVEEHMGCGYGVCKGCVVPLVAPDASSEAAFVNATSCQQGPVFAAESIDWKRFAGVE